MAFIFQLVGGFLYISAVLLVYILVFSLFYLPLKNILNKYNNIKRLPIFYLIGIIPCSISLSILWFISPEIVKPLFIITVSVSLFSAILCYFLLWIERFSNVGRWIKIVLLTIFLLLTTELVAVSVSGSSPPPEIYLSLYVISIFSVINTLIFILREELKKHRGNLGFYFNKFLDTFLS